MDGSSWQNPIFVMNGRWKRWEKSCNKRVIEQLTWNSYNLFHKMCHNRILITIIIQMKYRYTLTCWISSNACTMLKIGLFAALFHKVQFNKIFHICVFELFTPVCYQLSIINEREKVHYNINVWFWITCFQ